MTTIVYDHKNKQIACDSRSTIGGTIIDNNAIKHRKVGDKLWFISGRPGDADTFIKNFNPLHSANKNMDVSCIFVLLEGAGAGNVHMAIKDSDDTYAECVADHDYAQGSGDKWALAALDFGFTAKEAVEYAITKDVYSGGKVHVYDIEKEVFI
jgi:ATP-dependent protease HslVU (ClpYQ) peptidase subunit